ncbi:hypothetical protein [Paraburkholderia saeva]|uniref:Uncharacterized protein n=1 Tax=Paraburkholderia saeva TaxID=2777537 RepID=A0A9N8RYG9_9BURK|nr:hypothetical protein [Paraburkholderia saeva]CAG4903100.1 hypothetical protein LMG31841_03186 [Paraburkholderia saeva]
MSGAAMKWVMPDRDEPPKFTDMHAEKKWFLACLAWEANRFDNRICAEDDRDIITLAREAGVSVRAARRYVKQFVTEGILEVVGRTGYHNRVVIYLFTMQRTRIAENARPKRASNSTIQDHAKSASNDTIQMARNMPEDASNGDSNDTRMVPAVTSNGAGNSTIQPPSIYGLQELPSKPQEKHNAHWRVPSPVSRAKPRPRDDADITSNAAHQSAVAQAMAMIDEFYPHCETKTRGEVEEGCLHFAENGVGLEDMREAIRTAKRKQKPGSKLGWAAVANVLDGVLATRKSVIGYHQAQDEQIRRGAQQLEAIFERHLDKPSWTSGCTRAHMGEWLCRCVAWHKVDVAMFEAACRDAKKNANGRVPTWKTVRDLIDKRVKARNSGAQHAAGNKPNFDRPGAMPGSFIAQGNSTLH